MEMSRSHHWDQTCCGSIKVKVAYEILPLTGLPKRESFSDKILSRPYCLSRSLFYKEWNTMKQDLLLPILWFSIAQVSTIGLLVNACELANQSVLSTIHMAYFSMYSSDVNST